MGDAYTLSPTISILFLAQDNELRATPKPTQPDPDRSNVDVGVPKYRLAWLRRYLQHKY